MLKKKRFWLGLIVTIGCLYFVFRGLNFSELLNILKRIKVNEKEADILISVKNIEFAFKMITMRTGTIQAFMENRSTYKGDVPMALSLIRILNIVQFYLLPRIIAERVIKRLPKLKWSRRYYGRIRLYLIGIPLGR